MSEALKPMTAPVVEEHNIIENGPMTVEMRTENCGLFQLGGGIGRFNQTGATEPWRLPYEEVLYTLSGRLRLRFGDEVLEAGPGEVVTIPKGVEVVYEGEAGTSAFFAITPSDWAEESSDGR